ncbi:hypothetical protein IDH13_03535 [Pelagibacterales bacterium SAG-MED34]|nr:hypothetical protein [Pelagibacterales bacterium SAG-MED34]
MAHSSHYEGLKKIEMDVLRNNEVIGSTSYFFELDDDLFIVKNYTNFKVELFGLTVFSILSETIEKYKDDKLVFFKSNTFQNDKEKYVNLNYDKSLNKFIIDGSSYKGEASLDCTIGNWWNHKIFKSNKQISPLSGSIKKQTVSLMGNENITINGQEYSTEHFNIKSNDKNLAEEKKFEFDVWYNPENNLILKVTYNKMGNWEYRLRSFD